MTVEKPGVTRLAARLAGDSRRVLARLFLPGRGGPQVHAMVERVRSLSDAQVSSMLSTLVADYRERHKDIVAVFRENYAAAIALDDDPAALSEERRLLAGAYFTSEYSLEAAALFNPSMVPHFDQRGVPAGAVRFIMSLRACGEGHLSSIEFRTGVVDAEHELSLDPPTRFALTARTTDDRRYDKASFASKFIEMSTQNEWADSVLQRLDAHFTMRELKNAVEISRPREGNVSLFDETTAHMLWLARSNYEIDFAPDSELSERVIFPVTENESRGIEDARFVRFTEPDGAVVYYATYTAYNGFRVLPQLIVTTDFRHFKVNTLNGRCVQNKGMALFPRKIGGDYVMASRLDGENIYLLRSTNLHFWNESTLMREPTHPWEFVQIGNCGSPIETEKGWILLTHGVGPMRQYWIGALLLDLEDPSRVIGDLVEPLLVPELAERDGYVPNVVYSCGAMRSADRLVVPYAIADTHIGVVTVSIPELLSRFAGSAKSAFTNVNADSAQTWASNSANALEERAR
jgi:predicted GH43/DUF377 family glycosyl hydrolase